MVGPRSKGPNGMCPNPRQELQVKKRLMTKDPLMIWGHSQYEPRDFNFINLHPNIFKPFQFNYSVKLTVRSNVNC